jgi:hypothetical protein
MSNVDLQATLKHLQSTATQQVAQWPQYAGHFSGYALVRIKSEVKTKAGLAFTSGEYAIATKHRDELPRLPSSGRFVVAVRTMGLDGRPRRDLPLSPCGHVDTNSFTCSWHDARSRATPAPPR